MNLSLCYVTKQDIYMLGALDNRIKIRASSLEGSMFKRPNEGVLGINPVVENLSYEMSNLPPKGVSGIRMGVYHSTGWQFESPFVIRLVS